MDDAIRVRSRSAKLLAWIFVLAVSPFILVGAAWVEMLLFRSNFVIVACRAVGIGPVIEFLFVWLFLNR